jgi:hypothetical protein
MPLEEPGCAICGGPHGPHLRPALPAGPLPRTGDRLRPDDPWVEVAPGVFRKRGRTRVPDPPPVTPPAEAEPVISAPPMTRADREVEDLILEWLGKQREPVEEKPLLEEVKGRKRTKVIALRRLVGQGRVVRTGAGVRRDPYLYRRADM